MELHISNSTKKLVFWIWQFFVVLSAATVAACIFVGIFYVVMPRDVSIKVYNDIRERLQIWHYGEIPDLPVAVVDAERDHTAVVDWVNVCLGNPDRANVPAPVQMLMSGRLKGATGSGKEPVMITVPNFYVRILQLSHYILDERIDAEEELSHYYLIARMATFSAIFFSAATTLLVGLNATEMGKQQGRLGKAIRFLVLLSPVLGTAVAAIAAFYDPNGMLVRKNQTATALRQLHFQVSFGVPKMVCIKNDQEPKEISAQLDAWIQRLQELTAATGDSRAINAGAVSPAGPRNAPASALPATSK